MLSAALFVFRSSALLEVSSIEEAKYGHALFAMRCPPSSHTLPVFLSSDVFVECARLRTVPLIQYFLFADSPV